jgi:branched-chain amino acid transport system permease protein
MLALTIVTNSIIVGGLALGGLYAAVAVGFTVIYSATRAVNFAQGGFALVGAYLYWSFTHSLGWGQVPSVLAVIGSCAVLGVLVYVALLRRMAGSDEFIVIILTLGLSLLLSAVLAVAYGITTRSITVASNRVLHFIGLQFTLLQISALIVAVVAIAGITVVATVTRWGVVMKAVSENALLSGMYGLNVDWVGAGAWAIGVVLSGLVGVVFAAQHGLTGTAVASVGLVAFPAIMLGGMNSIPGGIVGGLAVGYLVTVVTTEVNPTWADLAAYALLLCVVLIRPQGLLGTKAARRV